MIRIILLTDGASESPRDVCLTISNSSLISLHRRVILYGKYAPAAANSIQHLQSRLSRASQEIACRYNALNRQYNSRRTYTAIHADINLCAWTAVQPAKYAQKTHKKTQLPENISYYSRIAWQSAAVKVNPKESLPLQLLRPLHILK